ncbi:hypothetical protein ACJX0J_006458, partial [Zea mays]
FTSYYSPLSPFSTSLFFYNWIYEPSDSNWSIPIVTRLNGIDMLIGDRKVGLEIRYDEIDMFQTLYGDDIIVVLLSVSKKNKFKIVLIIQDSGQQTCPMIGRIAAIMINYLEACELHWDDWFNYYLICRGTKIFFFLKKEKTFVRAAGSDQLTLSNVIYLEAEG